MPSELFGLATCTVVAAWKITSPALAGTKARLALAIARHQRLAGAGRAEDVYVGRRIVLAARHIAHATDRFVDVDQRDPRGHGHRLRHGPLGIILVRVCLATARLLVERLVMPDANAWGAEERRREFGDPGVEGQRTHLREVFPQILALDEGLLVGRLLR